MSDLIRRKAVMELIESKLTDGHLQMGDDVPLIDAAELLDDVSAMPTAYDVDNELRILKNYTDNMPKVYRKRNANWVIVQELLMAGTLHAGRTSSIKKCFELGIDAYDYELVVKGGGVDE